jgi:membrane protease YdiL (CAAX protease family)
MKTIKAFIKSHPVLSYFVLAFAISWGGILPIIGGVGAIPGTAEQTTKLFPAVYLVTVAGPSLAGLLLTGLTGGWTAFRELGSRLLKWRVGARWYAVALLTTPLTVMATLLSLSLISPEFLPGFLTTSVKASLLQFGFVAVLGLGTGFLEELGWTGFAVPTLLRLRYGVLATGLFVGLLWGAWRFLSNVWASGTSSGVPLVLFMPAILFSFLPPYRVLMVWVYERTGSLLVAMLMHVSLATFTFILTPPLGGAPYWVIGFAYAAALWVVVAAVAVAQGGHLSRQPLRRRET